MNPCRLAISCEPSYEATSEMREWFTENQLLINSAIRERIMPKLEELMAMELKELGFNKKFPVGK